MTKVKAFKTEDEYMIFAKEHDMWRTINGKDLMKVMAELKPKYSEEMDMAYAKWIEMVKDHERMWKIIRPILIAEDLI